MPANIGVSFQFSPSLVARDDAPSTWRHRSSKMTSTSTRTLRRSALAPLSSYDALVQKFDADGTFAGRASSAAPPSITRVR